MTRAEWRRDVYLALIIEGKNVKQMAKDLGASRAWIYRTLNEDEPDEGAVKEWRQKINKYCGLEGTK